MKVGDLFLNVQMAANIKLKGFFSVKIYHLLKFLELSEKNHRSINENKRNHTIKINFQEDWQMDC